MVVITPSPDLALFVLRLALAVIFLAHGPTKIPNSQQMAQAMGMKSASLISWLGLMETLAAALLILGVWTQLGAIIIMVVMLGAIYFKTQKWGKSFTGDGGWELDFIILAAALTVLLTAPTSYSLLP
jgi:putative oxidoreductase